MKWRLDIGARWAMRYTLALLVAVSVFGIFSYSQIVRRHERNARAMLEIQVKEIADAIEGSRYDAEVVALTLQRSVTVAEDDYKLGLQVFDRKGRSVFAGGSLHKHPLDLPEEVFSGRSQVWRETNFGDKYDYLVLAEPVPGGFVQGSLYTRKFVRNARDLRDIYLYSAPVLLLLTAGLGYWLARGSLRPIQEINRTARRISGERLGERIPTTGTGDELDELANTLNDMIARIRDSVERMRRFSANAAHELRTPLNALRSRLDVTLEKDREPAEYRRILSELAVEVEGLSDSVHGLMRLAQSEAGLSPEQRVSVELTELIREVVEFFEPLAAEADVKVGVRLGPPVTVPGDPAWLHQLFANLLHNAIKYTPAGGRVSLSIERSAGRVGVRVSDTGVGIAPAELERIFEPFHRVGARPETPGVGLGLPLAREIARAHEGEIGLESEPGRGSTFTVWLPLARPGARP
jgi:heavy metal sensor kinase